MLTEAQLLSALTKPQIAAARKEFADGEPDPIAEEIAAAAAKVEAYTAGRDLPPALRTGYARDLAAHQVAKRVGKATPDQVRAYERALRELEDWRDGAFDRAAGADGGVAGGSKPNILTGAV